MPAAEHLHLLFALKQYRPDAHLIKIGTMGEYGTPNIDIPEGFIDVEFRGRTDRLPFPRHAHSWYHWSKVAGSFNLMFACETYGLTATDVMQGVVFGSRVDAMGDDAGLRTRLDFDETFGTVINRFCCQAVIGVPLTPYGGGDQQRSFLTLQDAMDCLGLLLEHPPEPGTYRVVNQFTDILSIRQVAEIVRSTAEALGIACSIKPVPNPRDEQQDHYYNPDRETILTLGHRPQRPIGEEIGIMLNDLLPHRRRIARRSHVLAPTIRWSGSD